MPEPAVSFSIVAKNAAGKVLGEVNQDLVRTRAAAAGTRQSLTEMNGAASSGANIFAGFGGRLQTMTEAGHGANMGFRMIKTSMAGMALESVGAHNQVGRLLEGMLLFGVGSGPMIAIAAGLLGIVALYQHLSGAADEARDRLDKLTQANLKFVESKGHGLGAIAAGLYEPSDEDRKKLGDEAKSLKEQKADAERAVQRAKAELGRIKRLELPTAEGDAALKEGGKAAEAERGTRAALALKEADARWKVTEAEGTLRTITERVNQLLDDRTDKLREHKTQIDEQNEAWDLQFLHLGEFIRKLPAEVQKAFDDMPTGLSEWRLRLGSPNTTLPAFGRQSTFQSRFGSYDHGKLDRSEFYDPGQKASFTVPHFGANAASQSFRLGQMRDEEDATKNWAKQKRDEMIATHAATSGILAMAQAAASGQNALQALTAGLAQALPGLVKGPWGIVLGGAAALLGGILGSHKTQDVRVTDVSKTAADALKENQPLPPTFVIQLVGDDAKQVVELAQVQIARNQARDKVIRLPGLLLISNLPKA